MKGSAARMCVCVCVCVCALADCSSSSDGTPRAAGDPHGARPRAARPARQAAQATTPLPGHSIFHLGSTWTDQDGRALGLSSLRGKPTIVLMFYGACRSVCPTLIEDAKRVDRALPAEVRARLQYLLVTFDPEHDTTTRLREIAREHGLDTRRFRLVRGNDDAARELANVLGVQYRPTRAGEFAHSSVLSLLDRDGVLVHQTVGVARPVDEMVAHVTALSR